MKKISLVIVMTGVVALALAGWWYWGKPQAPQGDVAEEVKRSLVAKHGSVAEGLEVTVTEVRGNYAKGMAREEFGGGVWFGVLDGGQWIIVADGNGVPECAGFDRYEFPADMYGSCLDVNGEVRNSEG